MPATSVKPKLLTTNEAAEFLGVSAATLATWRCVARYALPFHKVGHLVKYSESDLLDFLERRKVYRAEVEYAK